MNISNGSKVKVYYEGRYYEGCISNFYGSKFNLKDDSGKFITSNKPGASSVIPLYFTRKNIVNTDVVTKPRAKANIESNFFNNPFIYMLQ